MRQLTLRVRDELAKQLKTVAARRNQSVNAYAKAVLAAAVDPDLADSESERVRARLARAGLLAAPRRLSGQRPKAEELGRARAAAAGGRSLSDLVSQGRG